MLRTCPKHVFLFVLFIGFLVRLFPELLAFPDLVGFDTVHYAARLNEGVIWHHWSNIFSHTWLIYGFLISIHKITQLSPEATFKIASPILYGLNAAGIYYFADKNLKWKPSKSLLASLLFTFSIASLRISWDLHRNMLGLGLLLFTFSLIPKVEKIRGALGFIPLSVLTVFSYELAAASLLFVVILFALRETRESNKSEALRILVLSLPALTFFLLGIYFRVFPIKYKIRTNIINVRDILHLHPFGRSIDRLDDSPLSAGNCSNFPCDPSEGVIRLNQDFFLRTDMRKISKQATPGIQRHGE